MTESCFVGAFGSACFRRVNVSDPDLLAAKPEGVTVDDAVAGARPHSGKEDCAWLDPAVAGRITSISFGLWLPDQNSSEAPFDFSSV
ncbi:hypothetical protein AB4Z40_35240 [Bosea sp. 2YAB26]|uniref:hypothetical protein n=1 Tax=Bosea sp. 2YAB26 TaxID=3237478 RepID=UPI003F906115